MDREYGFIALILPRERGTTDPEAFNEAESVRFDLMEREFLEVPGPPMLRSSSTVGSSTSTSSLLTPISNAFSFLGAERLMTSA